MEQTTLRPIQFSLRWLLLATAICAAICFLLFTGPTHGFGLVTVGMTQDEVRAIMGTPKSEWLPGSKTHNYFSYRRDWIDVFGKDIYFISFDEHGLVSEKGEESIIGD